MNTSHGSAWAIIIYERLVFIDLYPIDHLGKRPIVDYYLPTIVKSHLVYTGEMWMELIVHLFNSVARNPFNKTSIQLGRCCCCHCRRRCCLSRGNSETHVSLLNLAVCELKICWIGSWLLLLLKEILHIAAIPLSVHFRLSEQISTRRSLDGNSSPGVFIFCKQQLRHAAKSGPFCFITARDPVTIVELFKHFVYMAHPFTSIDL